MRNSPLCVSANYSVRGFLSKVKIFLLKFLCNKTIFRATINSPYACIGLRAIDNVDNHYNNYGCNGGIDFLTFGKFLFLRALGCNKLFFGISV